MVRGPSAPLVASWWCWESWRWVQREVVPATGGPAAAATIERPDGAGPPVAASGMGTQAALDNPRCRHDDPKYGPYGRFDTTEFGGGPVCVKAWKAGADNGGATAQGVTRTRSPSSRWSRTSSS